jgi:predicted Zn-ribbon and HTH transcriptional regulator
MNSAPLTTRQHLMDLLTQHSFTARDLASHVHLPERLVEDHLAHIMRSLQRSTSQQFVMEEPECQDCGFAFRNRTRLKRPSRCPSCRSEAITSPRFSIAAKQSKKKN